MSGVFGQLMAHEAAKKKKARFKEPLTPPPSTLRSPPKLAELAARTCARSFDTVADTSLLDLQYAQYDYIISPFEGLDARTLHLILNAIERPEPKVDENFGPPSHSALGLLPPIIPDPANTGGGSRRQQGSCCGGGSPNLSLFFLLFLLMFLFLSLSASCGTRTPSKLTHTHTLPRPLSHPVWRTLSRSIAPSSTSSS